MNGWNMDHKWKSDILLFFIWKIMELHIEKSSTASHVDPVQDIFPLPSMFGRESRQILPPLKLSAPFFPLLVSDIQDLTHP